MFYTKYRPQKFSQILKPNDVAKGLANQVKAGKVAHAYLFIGPRGTGKTTTARILAKALNCENMDKSGDPCDKCDVCSAIKTGNYMDLIEIDAASNRGIDDIRDLRDKIKLAPASGKKKVYIIDEVHMLTKEAFNALLKTLEEPPSHANFILCTTEEHKVPDTIKSRCQVFHFKRATISQIVEKLKEITKAEGVEDRFKEEDYLKIAKASFGGFRDAETILQQVVDGELDVDLFVGTSSKQGFVDFMNSLNLHDSTSAIRQINKIYEDGVDLDTWTTELLKYMRDLLFISTDSHEGLLDVSDDIFVLMEEQSSKIDPSQIVFMLDEFIKAQGKLKSSAVIQLPLEIAAVKICTQNNQNNLSNKNNTPADGSNGSSGPGSFDGLGGKRIMGGKGVGTGKEVGTGTGTGTGAEAGERVGAEGSGGGSGDTESSGIRRSQTPQSLEVSLDTIISAWDDVLKGTTKYNHGVRALLKSAKPVSIEGGKLILEVFYKFHKERLECAKNRKIVEGVLYEIFAKEFSIKCLVNESNKPKREKSKTGELTDRNIKKVAETKVKDALIDVFDGSLPL